MTCRLALVCSLSLASIGVAVAATGPELNAAIAGTLVADSSSIGPATLHWADWALSAPPPTVMEKTFMPEGWDPHEFSSPARYFWPNPSKPGGLPWIVRDGEPNLEAIAKSDEPRLARMVGDVVALVDAWSATGAEKYASRAELYLRAWFLDPATRMKPDFRGAQFIPGKNRGRGTGLIDMATFHRLLDAVAQLDRWPGRDAVERRDVAAWCHEYLAWLDSDRGAATESRAKNNHGTWFAVQRASFLVFLGKDAEARSFIAQSAKRLAAGQFAPDGEQPLESARADGISYSLYNLAAWEALAELGRRCGAKFDETPMRRAAAWLAPFVADPSTWPKSQKNRVPANADATLAFWLSARSPAS